jgi:hypothetical protein
MYQEKQHHVPFSSLARLIDRGPREVVMFVRRLLLPPGLHTDTFGGKRARIAAGEHACASFP